MSSRAEVTWQGGGTAVIDHIDDDRVELVSTRAFAPGSRPEGSLWIRSNTRADAPAPPAQPAPPAPPTRADAPAQPAPPAQPAQSGARATESRSIWLKIHGSRRQDDGAFRVKGRLLNVRRELLDLLKEVVAAPNGGKSSTS